MKKKIFIPFLILAASIFALTLSCEEDTEETCEEELICDDKTVVACCTSDSDGDITCVYKYNGQEYQESELEELSEDLGCSTAASASYKEDMVYIVTSLEALMERVRCVKTQE